MIRYTVRSRQIVDLVNELRSSRLVLSPFFQRNLVWRMTHKRDFIQTILLGYPFPQIFIAKGGIDVDKMEAKSCVVDGQQRMNAILEYVDNKLEVNETSFGQLSAEEKSEFLKYEVPIIDLDMDQTDHRIIDIFARLNRTQYALSSIEKQATEFGATEYMLVAKLLCGELNIGANSVNDVEESNLDPNITREFLNWATAKSTNKFRDLVLSERIFTPYEITRKVQLQFTLNVMTTYLKGNFNRNELSHELLEEYSDEFPDRENVYCALTRAADYILKMRLPEKSIWWRKANIFTLVSVIARYDGHLQSPHNLRAMLDKAAEELPPEYLLAAREAVNNRKERATRDEFVLGLVEKNSTLV